MNGRITSELRKVDETESSAQSAVEADSDSRDIKRTGEICRNGVCAITWKPVKPAAA
ncbi:MAG: hypothetical protein U0103_29000 [Candidatus Obscuribacterales bacterium]|nr:hypothetical protein [Cyanobacteria bacterium SZAS LIN-5]